MSDSIRYSSSSRRLRHPTVMLYDLKINKVREMSGQVFISYAHEDSEAARRLHDVISQEYVVFWDQNLVGGTRFPDEISRQISQSSVFLLLLPPYSSYSSWIYEEYREAIDARKAIIPVMLDSQRNGALLSASLLVRNAVNLTSWDGNPDSPLISKLLQDIGLIINFDFSSYNFKSQKRSLRSLRRLSIIVILTLCLVILISLVVEFSEQPTASMTEQAEPSEIAVESTLLSKKMSELHAPPPKSTPDINPSDAIESIVTNHADIGIPQLDRMTHETYDVNRIINLLNERIRDIDPNDYPQITQSIRLLEVKYPVSVNLVEAVFAANGFAETPCLPHCEEEAVYRVARLRSMGYKDVGGHIIALAKAHYKNKPLARDVRNPLELPLSTIDLYFQRAQTRLRLTVTEEKKSQLDTKAKVPRATLELKKAFDLELRKAIELPRVR